MLLLAFPTFAQDTTSTQKEGETANTFFIQGLELFNQAKFDKALEKFDLVLHRYPAGEKTLYYMGLSYQGLGLTDKAMEWYNKLLGVNPLNYDALTSMAKIYMGRIQYPDAVKYLIKLTALCPNEAQAYFDLGNAYEAMGSTKALGDNPSEGLSLQKKAIDYLTQGVALKPDNAKAHYLLGQIYYHLYQDPKTPDYKQRDYAQKAITAFENAFKYDPNNLDAGVWLSSLYRTNGRTQDALDIQLKLIAVKPTADLYYQLAETYLAMDNLDQAEKYNEKALALVPEHLDARELADTLKARREAASQATDNSAPSTMPGITQ